MISFDETFVDSAAPNANAIKNGKDLWRKGKIVTRHKDADGTILWGECKGSGKSNYLPSVDFITDATNPTYRCTCPSRQFPCKHALGLMYAFASGTDFKVADVPPEIELKRERAKARAEKRATPATEPAKPKKVNKRALAKKIDAQHNGLDTLEKMTHDLIRGGLGAMSAKQASMIEEKAKLLAGSFLPGAQMALQSFTTLFFGDDTIDEELNQARRESIYTEALDRLTRLQIICKRGREYLESRKADPDLKPDTDSTIAEWLGHAWKLEELKEHGRRVENAELAQLYFCSYDDTARKEFVEIGAWARLDDGAIQLTKNYRPYRAAKFIKEDDCFFQIAKTPELFVYPGDMNPRVRWNESAQREPTSADFAKIRSLARTSIADTVKAVKAQLKDPLADKNPYTLVRFAEIAKIGDTTALIAADGERVELTDATRLDDFDTVHLFDVLEPDLLTDQALLLRWVPDLDTMTLKAKPLSIVTETRVVRLAL